VFPSSEIFSCDIHKKAIQFLKNSFSVEGIYSSRDPKKFRPGTFDCVFALSFFSHMPSATWASWLESLWDSTAQGGFLIFTTQGLISAKYFSYPEIPKTGFWFRADSEQKDLDTADYGQTLVTSEFVINEIKKLEGVRNVHFEEGFWWSHQDLWVLFKE